ncbi:MAG TPA: isoaspartyl peptidase/L-asparaginase, partial [Flavobacteriales bacterium]|nr:isoaspartyl peptidase/L-asparaginase [Flavobacteriales bacterium]
SAALATKIVTRVTDGMKIHDAFQKSFDELKPYDGFAGAIGIDNKGNIHHQDSHPAMVFASFDGNMIEVFE